MGEVPYVRRRGGKGGPVLRVYNTRKLRLKKGIIHVKPAEELQ
jgi:hypothetical protein